MSLGAESHPEKPYSAARRVAKNTFYLALAEIANKLMTFAFFALAARHLGRERFGTFSFALAFNAMFSVFTDLGLGFLTAREIARSHAGAGRYVGNSLAAKSIASFLLAGLSILVARLLGYPPATVALVAVTSMFILASAVATYFGAVFQGFERMEFTALTRLLQTATLILGASVIGRGAVVTMRYAWLYVGAGFVAALCGALLTKWKLVRGGLSCTLQELKAMLKAGLPFGIGSVFVVLYYWNGTAFLSKFKDDAEVGLYSAAFRLVLGIGFLAYAFSGAMYPLMSRLHIAATERLKAGLTASLRYVLVLAVPMGVFVSVLASQIIVLIYGAQYAAAAPVLRILAWWGGLASLNSMLSNYLYAVDRPKTVLLQSALGLITNVALNLLLIPLLGGRGVAIAIVAAELCGTIILLLAQTTTASRADMRQVFAAVIKCFAAAAVAVALAFYVAKVLHIVPGLVAGLALYTGLIVLLRVIDRTEMAALGHMLKT